MANTEVNKMLDNASSTSNEFTWNGGVGNFSAVGTWNSATITLQYLGPDGVTFLPVGAETTLTADGGANFELHACKIRVLVTGSPSNMYASAIGVG